MTKFCPNCKKGNPDSAEFCGSCGEQFKINSTESSVSNKKGGWWGKQSSGAKAAIVIAGICCVGLILIIGIGGMLSPDKSTSNTTTTTSTSTTTSTPTEVTISQLYGGSIAKGTTVRVTGKVLQTDGSRLRMENSDGQDILVEGSNLNAYEDQSITVIGTFYGPSTYSTAMGSSRTVPTITDAKIG